MILEKDLNVIEIYNIFFIMTKNIMFHSLFYSFPSLSFYSLFLFLPIFFYKKSINCIIDMHVYLNFCCCIICNVPNQNGHYISTNKVKIEHWIWCFFGAFWCRFWCKLLKKTGPAVMWNIVLLGKSYSSYFWNHSLPWITLLCLLWKHLF